MPVKPRENQIAELRREVQELQKTVRKIADQSSSRDASKPSPDTEFSGDGGSVTVAAGGDQLTIIGSFRAGKLRMDSRGMVSDLDTGIPRVGETELVHDDYGLIYRRTETSDRLQAVFSYEFGPAVQGPRRLVMISEVTALGAYIRGTADESSLLPFWTEKASCAGTPIELSSSTMALGSRRPSPFCSPTVSWKDSARSQR